MNSRSKVVYLGNKFYRYKKVRSVLETLEPLFAEFVDIKTSSDKKNQVLRFLDMFLTFFQYGLKADKIIIDVYSTKAFYFAYVFAQLSKIFNKKYILFLHGGNLPYRFQKNPTLVRSMFRSAYATIAPSPYLKLFFESKGYSVHHIPNMISLEKYPFKRRCKIKARFLAIRGFGKPYNPLMTLKAMIKVKKIYDDFQLLMLGNENDFHYKDVVAFVQKNNMTENVSIKPKITRDDWVNLSEDYDIMISNPVIDNTPVSLIEGMALGMCVVSTKVGGVPYLVSEKECALVDSDDSEGLCKAILKILQDADNAVQLSLNGRIKAEEYDWKNIRAKWQNLLC